MCEGNTADVCEGKVIANVKRWVWVGCQVIHLHRWLRRHEIATKADIKDHPDLALVYYDLNLVFPPEEKMKQWFVPKVLYKLKALFDKLVEKKVLFMEEGEGKFHWPSWTRQWLSSGWNGDISPPLAAPPASPTRTRRQPAPRPISISSDDDDDDGTSVATSRQTSGISHRVPPTTPAVNNRVSATPIRESEPRCATRETTHAAGPPQTHQPVSYRPVPLTEAALRKKTRGSFASVHGQPITPPTSPPSIRSYGVIAEDVGINSVRFPDYDFEDYYQSSTPSKVTNNRGSATSTSNVPGTPRPRTRLSTTQTPEPRRSEASLRQSPDYSPSPTPPRTLFGQRTPYSPVISHLSDVTSTVPSSVDDEEWEQLLVDLTPSFYDGDVPVWANMTIRPSRRWSNRQPSIEQLVKMIESVGFTLERNDV